MHADALAANMKARWKGKFMNVNDVNMSDSFFLQRDAPCNQYVHEKLNIIFQRFS